MVSDVGSAPIVCVIWFWLTIRFIGVDNGDVLSRYISSFYFRNVALRYTTEYNFGDNQIFSIYNAFLMIYNYNYSHFSLVLNTVQLFSFRFKFSLMRNLSSIRSVSFAGRRQKRTIDLTVGFTSLSISAVYARTIMWRVYQMSSFTIGYAVAITFSLFFVYDLRFYSTFLSFRFI